MRNDVSGGPRSKYKKYEKMMRKNFQEVVQIQEVQIQKIRKNDEKRRFRRSKVKVQKIRKNDGKRLFRRWRGLNSKNP
jgi:6-phosphogluconolactonase/glucosamine-6-phosphate isomerase/deaminase